MNIKNLLNNTNHSLDEIINAIGFKRSGDKIIPKIEYKVDLYPSLTEERFLEVLTEYIELEIEFGKNPNYVINSLIINYEDQAIFKEMLAEE